MMSSGPPHQSTRTNIHDGLHVDLEAQNYERSYINNYPGGMVQTTSNSLFGSTNATASTVYERDHRREWEPQAPAPIHQHSSSRAPAPAPIEIPRDLPHVIAHTHSSSSLQPLTQPTPQSGRSAFVIQKTAKRHRKSFVRRHEQSGICASCFPLTSRPTSIRSRVLQSFLCFLLLIGVFAIYLGLSLSNEHLSTGVQVPLMVLLILSGILFVYVLLELCIFAQRANRVNGHHRLRSTVSFQVEEQPQQHRTQQPSNGHNHHHHSRRKHKKHRRRRHRRDDCPRHQIPLSPDDVLPNDDAIYTPTTPVRVHLLHDEESVAINEKSQLESPRSVTLEEGGHDVTQEMIDVHAEGGGIDESMIHPSLRRHNTAATIPIGPTSPVAATFTGSGGLQQPVQRTESTGAGNVPPTAAARGEVSATVVLGKAPPPAYGLWRCSVRADPNLLHWRRIDSLSSTASTPPRKEDAGNSGRTAPEHEHEQMVESAPDIAASMLRPTRYNTAATEPESEPPAYVSFVSGGGEAEQHVNYATTTTTSSSSSSSPGPTPVRRGEEGYCIGAATAARNVDRQEEEEEEEEEGIVMIGMQLPQLPQTTYQRT